MPCLLYTSLRLAQRSTGLRTEAVTVHAFEDNFLTIDINAIAGTVFDGAEAEDVYKRQNTRC